MPLNLETPTFSNALRKTRESYGAVGISSVYHGGLYHLRIPPVGGIH